MSAKHETNPKSELSKRLQKFNDAWRLIASLYGKAAETQPSGIPIPPDKKALAELKVAFMKISPLPPTLNLVENPGTEQEKTLRVPGLDLGTNKIPIKGDRKRVLTLGFLPDPTPKFQLFEECLIQRGRKELLPANDGTHQQIFEAKSPIVQMQMLRKALWKICALT